jgi:hypothetical protein
VKSQPVETHTITFCGPPSAGPLSSRSWGRTLKLNGARNRQFFTTNLSPRNTLLTYISLTHHLATHQVAALPIGPCTTSIELDPGYLTTEVNSSVRTLCSVCHQSHHFHPRISPAERTKRHTSRIFADSLSSHLRLRLRLRSKKKLVARA